VGTSTVVVAAGGVGVGISSGVEAAGLGTAVGVGVLGVVAAVRWAVGKWERAKRAWWSDWKRVGEGLGRDLKVKMHFIDNLLS
jgi:hypothetical protein